MAKRRAETKKGRYAAQNKERTDIVAQNLSVASRSSLCLLFFLAGKKEARQKGRIKKRKTYESFASLSAARHVCFVCFFSSSGS